MKRDSLAHSLEAAPTWRRHLPWLVPLLVGGGFGCLGFVLSNFRLLLLSSWLASGILALSLAFVWGRAGIFSFGQPAFFGVGGYLYGILTINFLETTGETVTSLIVGALAGAIFSAVAGYFMFYGRVADLYVGIITLAVTLVLFIILGATSAPYYRIGEALLGGYNGLRPLPKIILPGADRPLNIQQTFWFFTATATCAYLLLLWITRRPLGRIFAAVRENELRAELLGYDVRLHKLQAFTIGGAIAGLAGALFASWAGVVTPNVFSLAQMALVVIWVLVGGRTSLVGAFLGALLIQGLSNYLGGAGGILSGQTQLILGAVLVLFVLLLPGGLVPAAAGVWKHFFEHRRPPVMHIAEARPSLKEDGLNREQASEHRLQLDALGKSFGGLNALNGVTIAVRGPGLYCLLGPNGAGKSTLFNLLIGRYLPTSGRILLDGVDISRSLMHERARYIGVKLQQPTVFPGLSVYENAWLAAFARDRDQAMADRQAHQQLASVGLAARAPDQAGDLSHGEQQWLELGMTLAQNPPIILLDEPTAGMTRAETLKVVPVVQALASRHLVIVIEHDMTFVERLQAPITMLHQGAVFAEGSIEELRENEAVIDVYLGRSRHAAH